jgi:hypothetical protein
VVALNSNRLGGIGVGWRGQCTHFTCACPIFRVDRQAGCRITAAAADHQHCLEWYRQTTEELFTCDARTQLQRFAANSTIPADGNDPRTGFESIAFYDDPIL